MVISCPQKIVYAEICEYRQHFERVYCLNEIVTFDGIKVRFKKEDFDHCMYESSQRDGMKDSFSKERSVRIDWIKATLENPNSVLYQGWDSKRKKHDNSRRVAVVYEDFVVIIGVHKPGKARFITAYAANESIVKIRRRPRWKP